MVEQSTSPLGDVNMGDIGAALAAAGSQGGALGDAAMGGGGARTSAPPVQSLDFILDIPLKVTVELGRAKMAIRDILQLAQGSVIELSKFAGEPLEILIND